MPRTLSAVRRLGQSLFTAVPARRPRRALGDDILIGARTAIDTAPELLNLIFLEWTSTHGYRDRVHNLDGTGTGPVFDSRINGPHFLRYGVTGETVFADSSSDVLTGSGGRDLFFALLDGNNPDVLKDGHKNELVNGGS